ncbi:hypothetical protein M088_1085 [Bacteroides ovatus str. 3725 D1 iv]|nr:hypothetical protein M088_1085 [Bacteroides ovatus str. 3725 D1 iv]
MHLLVFLLIRNNGSLFIFLYINLNIDLGKRVYVKYNYGLRWLF